MNSFVNFPAALVPMLQQGFLERELEEGLDSELAYRREAYQETIPVRIGETITRSRKSRKAPITAPLNPSSDTGLDNGLTSGTFSVEQYSFTMQRYADTVDINMADDLAGIADQLIANSRNNGVQAAQSLERIARSRLFTAYQGGNTRVRTDLGASTTTTCHVDDISGFTTVLVNGVPTGISSANPITVTETAVSNSGVSQTLTVTAAAADATNQSTNPNGISGTLTFTAATAPVNGDALVAVNAPKIIRPYGYLTTAQLNGSDTLTMGLIEDGVAYLRDNGVPPMEDGTYHCILDNTSMRQLWADQDFKVLFAGRADSTEFRKARVVELLGVTYIPTTEAFVQPAGYAWGGTSPNFSYGPGSTATSPSAVTTTIRRPILMGAESIIQGNFQGIEEYANREGVDMIGAMFLVNNVVQILRPPLDRLQQTASLSWMWIGDFAVPTDITATTAIIPTASNALYKRALVIEHGS